MTCGEGRSAFMWPRIGCDTRRGVCAARRAWWPWPWEDWGWSPAACSALQRLPAGLHSAAHSSVDGARPRDQEARGAGDAGPEGAGHALGLTSREGAQLRQGGLQAGRRGSPRGGFHGTQGSCEKGHKRREKRGTRDTSGAGDRCGRCCCP